MKILIADDSKMNRALARQLIKDSGLKVSILEAKDGQETLSSIRQESIDILLLDIIMPKLTGVEVLAKINADKELGVTVMVMTTIDDKEVLKECLALGAYDYLQKPFSPTEFVARLGSAITHREMTETLQRNLLTISRQHEELQKAQFNLVQTEKLAALGELTAGVAHEINNPLAVISSNYASLERYHDYMTRFIEKVMEDKENPLLEGAYKDQKIEIILQDLPDLMGDLKKGIQRVERIVSSMRNFAHADRNDEFQFVSLAELLEEVLLIVNNELKYAITVEKDVPYSLPAIYCNPGQLEQVLMNLIINASHAIKKTSKPGLLQISASSHEDQIKLVIADNGAGIKEEHVGKIFDPFFTTKEVGEGTGLGLSITYDIIVNKHHGTIAVHSKEDEGTSFTITLPLTEGAYHDA